MPKPIHLDGRTGEGGGQLVRLAVGLAALTTQSVKITNIRGNRPRGGGLKNQHVSSIQWLAEATEADVDGLSVGSKTLTFTPRVPPSSSSSRHITIGGSTAASAMLVLQAVFPFIIFSSGGPITLEISGGTNVSFSPSYEYLDQVLLPTLERWGIAVERELKRRSWSLGSKSEGGKILLTMNPLKPGQTLIFTPPTSWMLPGSREVQSIDVNIIVPADYHDTLRSELVKDLGALYPGVPVHFKLVEDSESISRWYILLVAQSTAGMRWGRDVLTSMPKKAKSPDKFVSQISSQVCKDLYEETSSGEWVDEHLRDQIICFQVLSEGLSSMARSENQDELGDLVDGMKNLGVGGGRMRREKDHVPFGNGSLHAQTARWVAGQLLPGVEFYNKGHIVKGISFSLKPLDSV